MIKDAFFRTNFLSGNSASKSLEIKQKQRVSKTNEALIFVNTLADESGT